MQLPGADRHEFWDLPDASLLQPGGEGELVVSRYRSILAVVGWTIAMLVAYQSPASEIGRTYHLIASIAAPVLLALHLGVNRAHYSWWLGFLTSLVEVTLISGSLLVLVLAGYPAHALHASPLFVVYFFSLAATTVRLDHRAGLVAGLAAAVQYVLIVAVAGLATGWSLSFTAMVDQGVRTGLLLAMTGLAVLVTRRMQVPHVLSANDSLTGVLNRRAFGERWEAELSRARRYGRPISVAVLDIDYFKQFNDHHGHAAGDVALKTVARALRGRVRSTDFVGRLGGEEFAVALPETSPKDAMVLAEALRDLVGDTPMHIPGNRVPANVTISVGIASWPDHGEEITRLLDRADDRMYEAKLAGRNRVKGPSERSNPLGTPIPF
ncbi:MAG: diguanylate cyclase [Gemmatimonadota bacterium]